ncbi:ATP-binding protein [Streptomyces sp. NPDC058867]|uniref:ATP-binding protein n=1 Tax=unclassified Streptomyces TaxID=2593676 RepID=UPI0036965A2C
MHVDDEWLSPRARLAEASVSGEFDLSVCVREQIHLLGGVQSHGTLLAVDPESGLVDTAADNTRALLGVAASDLVGRPVTAVLPAEDWAEALAAVGPDGSPAVCLPVMAGAEGTTPFDLSVHRRGGLVLAEFEPREEDDTDRHGAFYERVRRALSRLRAATTVEECCQAAVAEVRALTGLDRVVAYRFDGFNGPGEVIAESVRDGWEPWLGLWFPASDIPPQARRLYEENWIRVISDVDDTTARLHPAVREATSTALDLSGSVLRTVSEFHLEYLRNIGVGSSMSVSLLRDGRLWGLIACHGAEPTRVPPPVRSACELFGTAFSMQLSAIEERERADALERAGSEAAAVAELLEGDIDASLMRHGAAVRDLVGAEGILLVRGGWASVSGLDVSESLIRTLGRCTARAAGAGLWSTDRLEEFLADEEGEDPADAGVAAGVLLVPLGDDGDFLAWLRTERPQPREWAADPSRPVIVGAQGERLTPRGSGAVFRSLIKGRSQPWSRHAEAAAAEIRRMLTGLVLRHVDELSVLNEELRMINLDLDSFAHVTAHDLKEPLRGIANAATFTLEDAADRLDAVSVRRLRTVRRLATRMDDLLNSLLHYARTGRGGLRREETPLRGIVDSALEVAGPRLEEEGVRVLLPPRLPLVDADPESVYEILVNLLVNAAKYAADRPDRTVEIAVEERVAPGASVPEPAVVVRDNGIGIAADRQEEVFGLFRRLHAPSERGGGTGVGLAIVKRIVERHGGRLWLTSAPGEGTAFYFTLGPGSLPPGG